MFVCSLLMSSIDNQTIVFGLDVDFVWFEVLNINVDSEFGVGVHHLHIKKWDPPLETVFTTCILKMRPIVKNWDIKWASLLPRWKSKISQNMEEMFFLPIFLQRQSCNYCRKFDLPGPGKKQAKSIFLLFLSLPDLFTLANSQEYKKKKKKKKLYSHLLKS